MLYLVAATSMSGLIGSILISIYYYLYYAAEMPKFTMSGSAKD